MQAHKIITSLFLIIFHVSMIHTTHSLGKSFYDERIEAGKVNPKVFDIGMKYIPDLSTNDVLLRLNDIIAYALPLLFGLDIAIEHTQFLILISLVRHFFTIATILPKSSKSCDDSKPGSKEMIFGHCYDKIFSGHFASTVLLSLILRHRLNINPILLLIFNVLYAILIIAIRAHYTVDLMVAVAVTSLIYSKGWKLDLIN